MHNGDCVQWIWVCFILFLIDLYMFDGRFVSVFNEFVPPFWRGIYEMCIVRFDQSHCSFLKTIIDHKYVVSLVWSVDLCSICFTVLQIIKCKIKTSVFPMVKLHFVRHFYQASYAKRHIFLTFDPCIIRSYGPCIIISTWSGVFICTKLGSITNKCIQSPTKTQHFPYGKSALPPSGVMKKRHFFVI